jgi:ammonium transporter, Amt family
LAWILLDYIKEGKASCLGACTAAVIGLVAITPAAGYVSVGSSIFIGVFSASFCYVFMASKLFKWLDDTLEVFSW